jgi:hypothetical protein
MKKLVLLSITALIMTACARGRSGSDGTNGANGVDGSGCSVEQTETGAVIVCADGTSAVVTNGADGHECRLTVHHSRKKDRD